MISGPLRGKSDRLELPLLSLLVLHERVVLMSARGIWRSSLGACQFPLLERGHQLRHPALGEAGRARRLGEVLSSQLPGTPLHNTCTDIHV